MIGVLAALGVVLSAAGIALFCWARIIQVKKHGRNRRVSVGSSVLKQNHIYESMDSIISIYAQTMNSGVTFGEEVTSPDMTEPAINQLEEHHETMQAVMSCEDTIPEAANSSTDTSSKAAFSTDTKPEVAIPSSPEAAISSIIASSGVLSEAAVTLIDTNPEADVNTCPEAAVTCPTSSNPAYGCIIEEAVIFSTSEVDVSETPMDTRHEAAISSTATSPEAITAV